MNRFYALSLQPDLFGTVSVVREWGRIGQPGTVRHVVCADETAARAALALRRSSEAIGVPALREMQKTHVRLETCRS
jgi:predicted DNA-binding WGR domain protein